ncbi:lipase family protein, partial [Pseudomonas sp. D47]|uniref:lipase family protein n=1 Tax=Pseudomonas sp. D47 TaxID=3159447 RepID=UPI00387B5C31
LSLMVVTAYGAFNVPCKPGEKPTPPPYNNAGSIAHVLQTQLGRLVKPTLFNDASPYHMLCEEVPYSKRLEIMPHAPALYGKEKSDGWDVPESVHFLNDKKTETQAFITHNDKVVLISVRGTQEFPDDVLRDMDAKQVPYAEGQGEGQAHRGFYNAFLVAKKFTSKYLDAFYTGEQTLIVCGHSLGGAIALLLAEWLRRLPNKPDVVLYTFGAPRAGNRSFTNEAKELAHHRIVNHNDPVPGVPLPWMDAEWKILAVGAVNTALPYLPAGGVTTMLGGLVNLQNDPYEHHGEQRHYMPGRAGVSSEGALLWQPGCSLITDLTCSRLFAEIGVEVDMPKRKSLVQQVLSAAEHSSHTGYSRSALTNLVRWYASVTTRGGKLFTPEEVQEVGIQVRHVQKLLDEWTPGTRQGFRDNVRRTGNPRFQLMPDALDSVFDDSNRQMRELLKQQLAELNAIQYRLEYQSLKMITHQDLFGDLVEHPDLPQMISSWRALDDIKRAEFLAQRSATTPNRYTPVARNSVTDARRYV